MAEKKSKTKNRRDAHGVYERREQRSKGYGGRESYSGRDAAADPGRNSGRVSGAGQGRKDARRSGAPGEGRTRNSYLRDQKKYQERNSGKNGRPQSGSPEFGKESNPYADRNFLIGRNPVIEALRAGSEIERIYMAEGSIGSAAVIRSLAKENGVVIDVVPKVRLDAMAPGEKHQGVLAEIPAFRYSEMEDLFRKAEESGEDPFFVILDEINDPHNLGAIIRTAECAGAHGVIIPKRRACGLTGTVAKSAAGALWNMPVVRVTNIARTIQELKENGVWICACDMDGETYYEASLGGPIAIVIGNEGNGINKLVLEKCDFVCSIPMKGKTNSLNASNAAAIMLYEIRRRRETGIFQE